MTRLAILATMFCALSASQLLGRGNINAGPFYSHAINDFQWVQRVWTGTEHYVFGRI